MVELAEWERRGRIRRMKALKRRVLAPALLVGYGWHRLTPHRRGVEAGGASLATAAGILAWAYAWSRRPVAWQNAQLHAKDRLKMALFLRLREW